MDMGGKHEAKQKGKTDEEQSQEQYFYQFPRLRIKLKSRHFDTIKVMKADSQAVLNILTEHDFQDAFKQMAEACIRAAGDCFERDGGHQTQSLLLTRWQHQ
jgi:hypothetical protein